MIDSESWTCEGCGVKFIGGRPADDLCRDCHVSAVTTMAARPSRAYIFPEIDRIECGDSWISKHGPNASVQLSYDIDLTFKSSADAQAAADACLKAAEALRELEARIAAASEAGASADGAS